MKYLRTPSERQLHENKSYFCSELAAAAFVTVGVLTDTRSPATYFPGDFSADENLAWTNGAHLDYECVIQF